MNSKQNPSSRRRFAKLSATAAISSLVCPQILPAAAVRKQEAHPPSKSHPRIRKVSLHTAIALPEMASFYENVLGMSTQVSESRLVIQAGGSEIVFLPAKSGTRPYYHFAFNIPENKLLSARSWLGERTKLSVTPKHEREAGLPNDVMPFKHWNAHSLFFWDPAGNILELICRHDLKNGTKGEFRSDEIFYVSEIGLVTEDVNELAGNIRSTFELLQYRGGGSTFRAIGDETGLLILFKRGGTPVGAKDGQHWEIHSTDIVIRPDMKFTSQSDPHSISAG